MNTYQDQARPYLYSGLGYPIPSAYPYQKFPPLTGWTGRTGKVPNLKQIDEWREDYSNSNILLRLAPNVIGIDVDVYDDKRGDLAINKMEVAHGALVPASRSTARGRGNPSGIRYYRLQKGMDERKLRGDLGVNSHVEIIRHSHRYAVVPASWHETEQAYYQWYPDRIPTAKDLTYISWDVWSHLTQRCDCFDDQRKLVREQMARYRHRPDGRAGNMLAYLDFENHLDTLHEMPAGSRNNYLSRIAGQTYLFDCLMNTSLPSQEVYRKLKKAALDAGLDENEIEATLESAIRWATEAYNEGESSE